MPQYWVCPRCRWKEPYPPTRCPACGLAQNGLQVDARMFERMNYSIEQIYLKLDRKEKTMSTIGSMMKRLLDKDTQILVKAGYINGDLELTDKGKSALWAILFSANKEALVAEAKEVLDAEKK